MSSDELALLDIEQVKGKLGLKANSTVYDWIKTRGFPSPIGATDSKRFSRFIAGEVDAWILAQIKRRDSLKKAA
jgi:predicted DNA-binding transcriptional regulator AlpA